MGKLIRNKMNKDNKAEKFTDVYKDSNTKGKLSLGPIKLSERGSMNGKGKLFCEYSESLQ